MADDLDNTILENAQGSAHAETPGPETCVAAQGSAERLPKGWLNLLAAVALSLAHVSTAQAVCTHSPWLGTYLYDHFTLGPVQPTTGLCPSDGSGPQMKRMMLGGGRPFVPPMEKPYEAPLNKDAPKAMPWGETFPKGGHQDPIFYFLGLCLVVVVVCFLAEWLERWRLARLKALRHREETPPA